ncbi:MAG: tetratricopeptide repeat protein [Cyanobacteria bacterium J06638_38]
MIIFANAMERKPLDALIQNLKARWKRANRQESVAQAKTQIRSLRQQGIDYRCQGCYAEAKSTFKKGLKKASSHQALSLLKARLLHELGIAEELDGNFRCATKLYRESIDLQTQLSDDLGQSSTLHRLAYLMSKQEKLDEAISYYEQALSLREQCDDTAGQASTLHQMAYLKSQIGDTQAAISLYEKLCTLEPETYDAHVRSNALHQLGVLKAEIGDFESALKLYQESYSIEQSLKNISDQAMTLVQIADVYQRQERMDLALACCQEVLNLVNTSADEGFRACKGAALHQIGTIRAKLGDTNKAITTYEEALRFTDDSEDKAVTLALLGDLLTLQQKTFERGLKYLRQALQTLKKLNSCETNAVKELVFKAEERRC